MSEGCSMNWPTLLGEVVHLVKWVEDPPCKAPITKQAHPQASGATTDTRKSNVVTWLSQELALHWPRSMTIDAATHFNGNSVVECASWQSTNWGIVFVHAIHDITEQYPLGTNIAVEHPHFSWFEWEHPRTHWEYGHLDFDVYIFSQTKSDQIKTLKLGWYMCIQLKFKSQ